MTSLEFRAVPPRPSDAERERALEVLRESAVEGRVSQQTFERRMGLILGAQHQGELDAVVRDLQPPPPPEAFVFRLVGKVSALPARLRKAWQLERLPQLLLPAPGPQPMTIGRAPGSMLRPTTARSPGPTPNCTARCGAGCCANLGSANGTWVNGRRLTGSVSVRPGDHVRFGQVSYRLSDR